MGLPGTSLELGFRQCSFHHTMQVLRDHAFCAFSAPPAFPPCSVPLCLSTLGKAANLWNVPSISSLLSRDTVLTVVAHELSIHVIQWETTLASVLDNVQDRFGCSHLAYLDVLSMGKPASLRRWAALTPLCPCRRLSRLRTTTEAPSP